MVLRTVVILAQVVVICLVPRVLARMRPMYIIHAQVVVSYLGLAVRCPSRQLPPIIAHKEGL